MTSVNLSARVRCILLLAIDVGNTNVVFALYDGETQITQWRVETSNFNAEDKLDVIEASKVSDVIVCSVVPDVNKIIERICQEKFNIAPVFITHENCGIDIDIDTPSQMGADRLVVAVAAYGFGHLPAIIVDLGTATTFDVINEKGVHCGGVIAPGINLSLAALEQAAAQLPDIEIAKTKNVIGKNTKDAMQSGIYWGYISLIEGLIEKLSGEISGKPHVIATGGLAPLFEQGTNKFDFVDSDLIMKGLVHIHKGLEKA